MTAWDSEMEGRHFFLGENVDGDGHPPSDFRVGQGEARSARRLEGAFSMELKWSISGYVTPRRAKAARARRLLQKVRL